jgi:hypothetical protein
VTSGRCYDQKFTSVSTHRQHHTCLKTPPEYGSIPLLKRYIPSCTVGLRLGEYFRKMFVADTAHIESRTLVARTIGGRVAVHQGKVKAR